MTFIKKVINSDSGTADLVGGDNWDTLDDYFDDVATGLTAKINSNTVFRSGVFKMRNPANSFNYQFVAGAISADRILNWPVTTATDTLAVLGLAQTFSDTQDIRKDATNLLYLTRNTTHSVGTQWFLHYRGLTSTSALADYCQIGAEIIDDTNASVDGKLVFKTTENNTMTTVMTLAQDGQMEIRAPSTTQDVMLKLFRNSGNNADKCKAFFDMKNSVAAQKTYGVLQAVIADNTSTSEDGTFRFELMKAGTIGNVLEIQSTGEMDIGNNLRLRLAETGLTAQRTFTFPDITSLVAVQATDNLFSVGQTITDAGTIILNLRRDINTGGSGIEQAFRAKDSAANYTTYAGLRAQIVTNTDPIEDGKLFVQTRAAGTNRTVAEFQTDGKFACGGPNTRVLIDETGLTAQRTFTWPDSTALVAGSNIAQTFTLSQTFTKSVVLNGGMHDVHLAKTANYTLLADDSIIRADASAGAFTLTLPASASNDKKVYKIIRTDILASTNMLTIDPNASETIDQQTTMLLAPGEEVILMSDGTNWLSLARTTPTPNGYYFLGNSTNNRRYVAGLNPMCNNALLTSTSTPAANTLWAMPFYVSKTTKFDTISFEVTTLIAAKNARCGIYSDNGNCYPGALIFDTGSVSVATTGVKDTTITAALQVLQPGLYWLTWETDSTVTLQIRILPGAGTCIGFAGIPNTMGTTSPGFAYSVAHTYGALPNPYTGSATLITTPSAVGTPIPAVAMRSI